MLCVRSQSLVETSHIEMRQNILRLPSTTFVGEDG